MPKTHFLKIHPQPFEDVRSGIKTAEFRFNDRDYQVGDLLVLQEYDPLHYSISCKSGYTGRKVARTITRIQTGYGIPEGYCVLSLSRI